MVILGPLVGYFGSLGHDSEHLVKFTPAIHGGGTFSGRLLFILRRAPYLGNLGFEILRRIWLALFRSVLTHRLRDEISPPEKIKDNGQILGPSPINWPFQGILATRPRRLILFATIRPSPKVLLFLFWGFGR